MRRLALASPVSLTGCGSGGGGGGGGGISPEGLRVEVVGLDEGVPAVIKDGPTPSDELRTIWTHNTMVTPANFPTAEDMSLPEGFFKLVYPKRQVSFAAPNDGVIGKIVIKDGSPDWTVVCEPKLVQNIDTWI